jgi:uncharacterized OsmC-like protein
MFSLKNVMRPRNLFTLPRFNFARDVGDVSHLKKFRAGAHKNVDNEVRAFYGESTSILITQPLETLLSCLSACELKSIMYWAKENNVKIDSLEISTDAVYDSLNYLKNSEGKDIRHKVDESQSKTDDKSQSKSDDKSQSKSDDKSQSKSDDKSQSKSDDKSQSMEVKSSDQNQTEKYRNKKNVYEEVNVEVNIKTSEKDRKKVLEVLKKGQETCPVHNMLTQAGIKMNSKLNIL